ncbi:MAG: hypothetical protein ABIP38_00850, partial [Steroidobacteraceae bacterium]
MRLHNGARIGALALLAALLGACGGGETAATPSAPPPPVPVAAVSKPEAFRFLNQASFGATETEAA